MFLNKTCSLNIQCFWKWSTASMFLAMTISLRKDSLRCLASSSFTLNIRPSSIRRLSKWDRYFHTKIPLSMNKIEYLASFRAMVDFFMLDFSTFSWFLRLMSIIFLSFIFATLSIACLTDSICIEEPLPLLFIRKIMGFALIQGNLVWPNRILFVCVWCSVPPILPSTKDASNIGFFLVDLSHFLKMIG